MVAAGDLVTARRIDGQLQASYRYMNTDERVFSQSVKVAMDVLGVPTGECRLPLGPAPEGSIFARGISTTAEYSGSGSAGSRHRCWARQ